MSFSITTHGSLSNGHGMLVVNRVGADGHDDGLVHAHEWATARPEQAQDGSDRQNSRSGMGGMMVFNRVGADGHDDGLVHAHEWAAAK